MISTAEELYDQIIIFFHHNNPSKQNTKKSKKICKGYGIGELLSHLTNLKNKNDLFSMCMLLYETVKRWEIIDKKVSNQTANSPAKSLMTFLLEALGISQLENKSDILEHLIITEIQALKNSSYNYVDAQLETVSPNAANKLSFPQRFFSKILSKHVVPSEKITLTGNTTEKEPIPQTDTQSSGNAIEYKHK